MMRTTVALVMTSAATLALVNAQQPAAEPRRIHFEAGRIVEKRPAFLTLRTLQDYSPAPMNQANWIGSRVTVQVDWVIQTIDTLPLESRERLTFIDESEGSATVNGVHIETETPWLWPIESGRRYLVAGRVERDQFMATGMWMEPTGGGSVRSHIREVRRPGEVMALRAPNPTPFDDWTIEEASVFLEQEVQRRAAARK